ncbi:probable cytochrome P450 301a1, mitochondrial isoform X2 [Penaeus japonicus]|nr:probable cytochrome P450 301a1, mitochondrial isoform X2 [Penaeus japonicus]XP_042881565.1 probable cytochrome P450 301a1, mitochondrial isoform X2 [Penaeus japonicus]
MSSLIKQRGTWASFCRRGTAVISRSLCSSSIQGQVSSRTPLEEELRNARPTSEIPGPKAYPLVGSMPKLIKYSNSKNDIHKMYLKLHDDYGPIFRMIVPGMQPISVVSDPDDFETLLRSTMHNPLRMPLSCLKAVREESSFYEEGMGIMIENGDEWWRVRSKVQTPMMKPKLVGTYLQQMDQVSIEFTDRIAQLQADHGEMPDNFLFEMNKWALESVGLVALNRRLGCFRDDLAEDSESLRLIRVIHDIIKAVNDAEMSLKLWKIVRTPSFKKLKRKHDLLLEIAMRHIQETEAAILAKDPDSGDELSLMENLMTVGLSKKDVVTLIEDMLFASIDTTSNTLGFLLYLLARNPEVQAKLQAEVDTVLGDHQGPLLPRHLAQFSYMKCVFKESLRIFPPGLGIGRALEKDTVLGGYIVPKGDMVMYLGIIAPMDETMFPRAKEFIPDRWSRDRPLGPIHPYASLPFSTGTRMCIGRRIAEQEMYTFLARIMQRFTVDYKHRDMDIQFRILFRPSEPLRFSFTERK